MAGAKTTGKRAAGTRPVPRKPPRKGISPKIAEALEGMRELCETLEAGEPIEQKFRVTYYTFDLATPGYGPADVRRVRALLMMSQANFATFMGVDASTVQSWEQGIRNPSGTARRLMQEVEADPKYWRKRIMAAARRTTVGPK
jgi:putative transcriptional regulator